MHCPSVPRPVPQSARRTRGGAERSRGGTGRTRTWPSGSPKPGTTAGPSGSSPTAASTSRCFRCCGRSSGTGCTVSARAIGPRPAISSCAPEASGPLLLFKALQLLQCRGMADPLQDYVAFDLETTEKDPAECEIVELAAVRVRGRVIVEQFQRLVRPSRPITSAGDRGPRLPGRGRLRPAHLRGGLAGVPRVRGRAISSWRTTATPSTFPCSAGSRRACRVSTSSCSSTRCRWPVR